MIGGLTPAPGVAGAAGLLELPDGSLVRPGRYDDRYGRGANLPVDRDGESRTETERDRGRLGYSSALRRLAGVTQVVSPDLAAARMHSRESHTHKVSLVARELAELVVRKARTDRDVADLIFEAGGLDIAACEAAGLAHDLGHAPFGHAGEVELHNLLKDHTADGFEGNPQSFRIVTRLDGRTLKRTNMELTNVTLCAILKYPWARVDPDSKGGQNQRSASASKERDVPSGAFDARADAIATRFVEKPSKFGAYVEDWAQLELVRSRVVGPDFQSNRRQTLEASIMDLADDIAYAIHDLEDFCSAGMIDLADVLLKLKDATAAVKTVEAEDRFRESTSTDPFTKAALILRKNYEGLFRDNEYYFALERIETLLRQVTELSASEEALPVVLRDHLSRKIGQYFASIEIDAALPYSQAAFVRLSAASWHEVQVLKVITRHWLIQSPQMGMIQRAQTRAIRTLFHSLVDWLGSSPTEAASLPKSLRDALTSAGVDLNTERLGALDERHYRAIGDYISGLSDSEALLRSNWFAGREIPGMTVISEAY